ncbi:MAG: hypothetical protein JW762_07380 [Dehalococcoidales bacterium]|nr:hypothetical protein [Dehalococcoidales bacterium]
MSITGVYKNTIRIFTALALVAATMLGSLPATVKAAPDPVDLELNAAGYTPIIVNNIMPGDSGGKTVELTNVGTNDGLLYIWLSNIIDSEGLNPDSETGDTSGDGELGEYLMLDIDVEDLSTNLALPATVDAFPTSAADLKYITVIPLKAGETRMLDLYWELPPETGNVVQGDELSFTVTYFLREMEVPDDPVYVPPPDTTPVIDEDEEEEDNITLEINLLGETVVIEVGEDGILEDSLVLTDPDGMCTLEITGGTHITGIGGTSLDRIVLTVEETTILLPDDTIFLTPIYWFIGYDDEGNTVNARFDPPVRLILRYDPDDLPENALPPYVARYTDEEGLVRLESPVKFPIGLGRVDALLDICSMFMALVEAGPEPPPLPPDFTASNLVISPDQAFEGDSMKISVTISNEGSKDGTYELYLIVDGIVRGIQEVALSGKSSGAYTFEISDLAAGVHQIKAAGLTETIRIDQVAVEGSGAGVNWTVLDLSVAGVVLAGLVIWFLYMLKARRRAIEIGI